MYGGGGHWQNAPNPNGVPFQQQPVRPGLGAGDGYNGYQGAPPMMGTAYGQHASFASPPSGTPPAAGGAAVHTTVFVGTISAGVSDMWLTRLLSVAGHLRSFKRVNASFGFADFMDAESTLRALAVLAGIELPAMGKEADEKPPKKLTVKADEKTRKYLDQYQEGRTQTAEGVEAESMARASVQQVLLQMSDPANVMASHNAPSYDVPSHLKDLPPEDVPEEHRGAVLSEIDKFRQASAAREDEKRRRERVQEMERLRSRDRPQRNAQDIRPPSARHDPSDRQSHLKPVNFVASQEDQHDASLPADERDDREEQRKIEREKEHELRDSQEAERRYLTMERNRLAHWDRELARVHADDERRKRAAASQIHLYEEWDQEKEFDRDVFYTDRQRWRAMRRPIREQEERDDLADRKAQAEEEEKAREEAERFLAQQAEDMAAFERQQRAAGVLMPNDGGIHAPLKLKRTAAEEASQQAHVQPGVLGAVEDESEQPGARRGRLAHIDLTDASDMDALKDKARRSLPKARDSLFGLSPKWDRLNPAAIDARYGPLLDKGIVESLGESVPDMVDELIEKIRKHAPASELIEVVEPVLEDEAPPLIEKLWVELLVDTMAGS